MCAKDKEKELSQLSSTQPSAPLINSVNAVEITSGGSGACKSVGGEESEREKR